MSSDLIQSTMFIVDVVDKQVKPLPDYIKETRLIESGGRRLRVRERYTYIVPIDFVLPEAWQDDCRTDVVSSYDIESESGRFREITRETELDYEQVGPGTVTIEGNSIRFHNAGLRCWSRACGPVYAAMRATAENPPDLSPQACQQLRSAPIVEGIGNYLRAPKENWQRTYWQDYLISALSLACFNALLNENVAEPEVRSTADPGRRVYYFHVDAYLPPPDMKPVVSWRTEDVVEALKFAVAVNEYEAEVFKRPPYVDPNAVNLRPPLNLAGSFLRPIFWFPFKYEAFAFGAITSQEHFRLYGRMGALTDGYVATDDVHWAGTAGPMREKWPLTLAEDVDPMGGFKYAEFDAGPLPPGDNDFRLKPDAGVSLWPAAVPFYLGAMPLMDPTLLKLAGNGKTPALVNESGSEPDFCYLEGTLDMPILFDPIVNCQGCN